MRRIARAFRTDKRGATAIEYGLIAAVVSMIIIGGSGSIASALKDSFSTISGSVATANAGG
jgi:pilus assembly protein Flp/PilA